MNLQEHIRKVLKEETSMKSMMGIVNESSKKERRIKSINLFLKTFFPYFNKTDIIIQEKRNGNKYFLYKNELNSYEVLAIIDEDDKELVIDRKIFTMLEKTFGNEMDYIVDWFNQEFNENTEYVTF